MPAQSPRPSFPVTSSRRMAASALLAALALSACATLQQEFDEPVSRPSPRPESRPNEAARPERRVAPQPQTPADFLFVELRAMPLIGADSMNDDNSSISYQASAGVEAVVRHYERELTQRGWKKAEGRSDNKNYAVLEFSRAKERLSLTVSLDSSASPPRSHVQLQPLGSMEVKSLPKYPGAKSLYASPSQSIVVTADKPDKVHAYLLDKLKAAGWRETRDTARGEQPLSLHSILRQDDMELSLQVSVAPAQKGQTSVQYYLRQVNNLSGKLR